jgi:hypothetical protein
MTEVRVARPVPRGYGKGDHRAYRRAPGDDRLGDEAEVPT